MRTEDKNEITLDEAAALVTASRQTIWRRVKSGKLQNVAAPVQGLNRQPVKLLRSEVLAMFAPRDG